MSKSEQMLAALQEQDLALADRYFEQALTTDSEEELLDLADYLESIGFFPQAKRIFEKLAPDYPASYISLAAIAMTMGTWSRLLPIWRKFSQTVTGMLLLSWLRLTSIS